MIFLPLAGMLCLAVAAGWIATGSHQQRSAGQRLKGRIYPGTRA